MQTDKTTKALLALIAIGLFLNVFVPLLQPPVVNAQSTVTMESYLGNIESRVRSIAFGICLNDKIC